MLARRAPVTGTHEGIEMTGTGRQWDWSVAGWQITSGELQTAVKVSTERQGIPKENVTARTQAPDDTKN